MFCSNRCFLSSCIFKIVLLDQEKGACITHLQTSIGMS